MAMTFLFLTEDDVRRVLPPAEFPALVDLMQATVADFSAGRTDQPVRTAISVGPPGQYLGLMPAFLPGSDALGTKLVSVVPSNATRGLSSHMGIVALFDTVAGALRAVMDARYITEVRTAAVSAVSVRLMARRDAGRLALVGTGVQARSHLQALAATRPLTEVRAWSPQRPHADAFAAEMTAQVGITVRSVGSAEEAVNGADLVVLATASDRPVVRNEWIADGTHVVSVGACRPHQREMDPALMARARVVVDSRAAALVESGDVVSGLAEGRFGADHIAGELGNVVSGTIAGRTGEGEVTVFKSLGLEAEDVATAAMVCRLATRRGLGVELAL